MAARIISRPEGINQYNLPKVIEQEHCRTLAKEHYALVCRTFDRTKLARLLRESLEDIEEIEREQGTNLSETQYIFVASTKASLERSLGNLTRRSLNSRGIEPVILYAVNRKTNEVKVKRDYQH